MNTDQAVTVITNPDAKEVVMKVVPKTVYLFVGPPNCGKSTYAKAMNFYLKGPYKTKMLSSDDYRRELLDDVTRDKHDPEMMHVSEAAFIKLFQDLELCMKWPQNYDFIFVDTTGIAKEFRDKVMTLTRQNHYRIEMVLFNYKDIKSYFIMGANKHLTTKFLTRMRQDTLRELNRKSYDEVHKIAHISKPKMVMPEKAYQKLNTRNFSGTHTAGVVGTITTPPISTFIVGDVHGCFEEMVELLALKQFRVHPETLCVEDARPDEERGKSTHIRQLVFVGDLIDKGPNSAKMIEFAYANKDNESVTFVSCNHGNFVYKYLKGMLDDQKPETLAKFDTVALLKDNEELKEKFFAHWEATVPYYRNRKVIVTHAPCEVKYLEKPSEEAMRSMRNFRYPRLEEATDKVKVLSESLQFLEKEAVKNQPYHVFGHVSLERVFQYKNKICIDTGCFAGGKLTMVEIPHYESKPFFHSVKSKQPLKPESLHPAPEFVHEFSLGSMEPQDFRRVKRMAQNKINFVSGTVSPSDKINDDVTGTYDLESLEQGVKYYLDRGYTKLKIQPKYMGSRCNMYLVYENGELKLEECYAVSRQGFKIRHVEGIEKLYTETDKLIRIKNEDGTFNVDSHVTELTSLVILDGELLPWTAMGSNLIDRNFFPARDGVNSELQALKATGFEEELEMLRYKMSNTDFASEIKKVSKKELIEKYTNSVFSNYRSVLYFNFESVDKYQELNDVYAKQLEIFCASGELEYRPWNILKHELTDGTILMDYAADIYDDLAGTPDFTFDVEVPEHVVELNQYWNMISTEKGMEGVVIKPAEGKTSDVKHAPYLKVRNPRYLTLVYGYDYLLPTKYEKLLKQKSTMRKMRVSAKEHEIGRKMLMIPHKDISLDNKQWVSLASAMVMEEKNESGLDPRL